MSWNVRLLFKYDIKKFSYDNKEILNLIVNEVELVKILRPGQFRP